MPPIGFYNLPKLSVCSEKSQGYSFNRAILPSVLDENIGEYQFNYKHKMSDYSSFNFKELGNYSIEKQLGRDKVGFLKELNKFFKVRKKNTSIHTTEVNDPFSTIHKIEDTKSKTKIIQNHVKKIQKLAQGLTFESILKASREKMLKENKK
mmetsp:Transcript_10053/g.11310  ORF Transcript_10053/g.11310 Transcript_10053/m.11310 type:complete len:151 (-) Transcript_10053:35-487(-)|eukprot:CAMPEP_0168323428 /NCGR_PEP_ID=MMETSP0213-20121227/3476_1 /TAXON_ID=151035 /ORGANISM="Euplotes harpa, Strain FSP1.4" /LENGTH=150 /DNA_ID=CAMNT_0008325499 /DNA_START=566 /DNA_END=1018 /DNA_ORIENTATION=+